MSLRAALWVALLGVAGCGLDGLFFTPRGFDPTDRPTVTLVGVTQSGALVQVISADGRVIATRETLDTGTFEVALPPDETARNLRVIATRDWRTFKTLVPSGLPGDIINIGALDPASTAAAQLATYEVTAEAGSTFGATPPPALVGLLRAMAANPTPELGALTTFIDNLLGSTFAHQQRPFDGLTFELSEGFANEVGLGATGIAEYRALLAAAARGYGLEIRCDPSRLNVMFTVDASGRGRDGNGTPQLIRQPTKGANIYLGFTADESSAVSDPSIPRRLAPNDPDYAMSDDGQGGDEVAGDGVYTVVVPMPRGARIQYKYTNGSAGEGFTGTEEWPGNARIIEVQDVLTGRPDGEPDCLVVRRDSFGDEASNKNFVNLNTVAKKRGGTLAFGADLGGIEVVEGRSGVKLGGLTAEDLRSSPPLTPTGVPEARENGTCAICPAPLILDPDDMIVPKLISAERLSVDRVRLRFSEPILAEDARDTGHYLYLDDAGARVEIQSATPSGSDVVLVTDATHPTTPARIKVQQLRDVSANGNTLSEAVVNVAPDRTAPKVLSVRARSLLDLDPSAPVADPTVGEIVDIVLDERPESSAASDPRRFLIDGLVVRAASEVAGTDAPTLRLVTEVQDKRRTYTLTVVGLRDVAGNALEQETTFDGFALYKVRFGVVPGFAFASSDGTARGLPRSEQLYLTGTPLAAARDLAGRNLTIIGRGGSRTDVTGWPEFEMTPSSDLYEGRPIYRLDVLLPPGSWAWKSAHGVEGEYARAPPTLEKVYKVLSTANDATGVRVDPVTMRAANGVEYAGAALSDSGEDPPRTNVVFKREAPDEVCEVVNRDIDCPLIVVGTWRDLVLDQGGRTRDYDDGIVTLEPHRPTLGDIAPPKLLDARARDSYSVLLSYDERIVAPSTTLTVELARADDGVGLPVVVLPAGDVKPHQAVVRVQGGFRMSDGLAYTVRYRGATDPEQRADRRWRTATVLAPDTEVAFRPLIDASPPMITRVDATDLNELVVSFDETLDPATVSASAFVIELASSSTPLALTAAELTPNKTGVRLATERQRILEPYRLTVAGIGDVAEPANVLASTTVDFVGFGERSPPTIAKARAIGADRVLVRFDEPVEAISALDMTRYSIDGLAIRGVVFSGDPARRRLAFNPTLAPRQREAVLLDTSPMQDGMTYALVVDGVKDLSGNAATATVAFTGVSAAPTVDVVLEYQISDAIRVGGRVPSRAISPAVLSDSREGVFVLGARALGDGTPAPGSEGPGNADLGGFPPDGLPLDGIEPRLRDDGTAPDRVGGDSIFTIRVRDVPLGTTLIFKAFAPFTTAFRDRNPSDSASAFADGLPGPSVYGDGQEYPGNENGVLVLDEGVSPGEVRVRCLFGDEVTYKKHTDGPAFIWIVDDQ